MDKELLTYGDSSDSSHEQGEQNKTIDLSDEENKISFKITSTKRQIHKAREWQFKKDNYQIIAIRNLLKKTNFLTLTLRYYKNQISKGKFSQELDEHPEKYILNIENIKDTSDILIITDIVKKIGLELDVDQVADIFSISSEDIDNAVSDL